MEQEVILHEETFLSKTEKSSFVLTFFVLFSSQIVHFWLRLFLYYCFIS